MFANHEEGQYVTVVLRPRGLGIAAFTSPDGSERRYVHGVMSPVVGVLTIGGGVFFLTQLSRFQQF